MHQSGRTAVLLFLVASGWVASEAAAAERPVKLAPRDAGPARYRGRENRPRFEDAILWVPRLLFYPLHLLAEFAIRRPLYALFDWAERNHALPYVQLVLRPSPRFEWAPTVSLDFGIDEAFGVRMTARDLGFTGNTLYAYSAAGTHRLEGELRDRIEASHLFGELRLYGGRRNRPFYGLGPDSEPNRAFFEQDRAEGTLSVGFDDGKRQVALASGYRWEQVGDADIGPPIGTTSPTGLPPGFAELHLAFTSLHLMLDTRDSPDDTGGLRIAAALSLAQDLSVRERAFATLELDAAVAVEVVRPGRVLTLRLYAADAVPFGNEPVPLTHLSMLGGRNHIGFPGGRFRGESALLAEVRYRYPVAYYADAQLIAGAGNVFARDLHDFCFGELTTTLAVGVRTRQTDLLPIEVMVGVGTSRFDQPFAIDSVRVYVGTAGAP
jgi:hypothetical protein